MAGAKTGLAAAAAASILALATPLVAYYEGYVPHTYADPVGIPTICYGHTGQDVTAGRVASRDECLLLLRRDLTDAYGGVVRCIGVELESHEAAALTSFVFNTGATNLCRSTLAKLANGGAPASTWCAQLDAWVYAKGVYLPGLAKRRAAERALCEGRASHVQ